MNINRKWGDKKWEKEWVTKRKVQDTTEKQRTILQNRALHLFFKNLATTLNEKGLDMREVLKPGIDIPWSPQTIKEYIWRPIQKAYKNKVSTTELTTKDIDDIFDVITKHFGEKFGIYEPFPSIETIMMKLYDLEEKNKMYNMRKEKKRLSQ